MDKNSKNSKKKKILGFVYDVPTHLKNFDNIDFPEDATAEWENQNTLNSMVKTWQDLEFEVILFPLDETFLKNWKNNSKQCHLIHSVVEGFGSLAREGWIPSLCELSGVPYIGSTPFAHSLCMHKAYLKSICAQLNISTAPFKLLQSMQDFFQCEKSFFNSKLFFKPNAEGSGMGIDSKTSISTSYTQAKQTIAEMLQKYPEGILVEKYLAGPEYTSAIIGTPHQFLPIAQIEVEDGVYGAVHKKKDFMGEKVTFPALNLKIKTQIEEGSRKIFSHIPLFDFARLDWKCDARGKVYFLEANTLAGLSSTYSVLPLMAMEAGINYHSLFKILSDSAMTRMHGRNLWYGKSRIQ